ncbi:MAG TPA: hypothetical protein ENG83_13160 [Nitrospirae bacterium]|nr:hypothetical protein BMS3Abin06_01830 [bacterium BMS3Abin06]HDH13125.1 hypothetical protein [Nitrospirota bacterium]HDZ03319.1 hypothetical protein [Nitrospirota bacterium]
MPRAALEVTAKDQDGNVIYTERRNYDNWNLWFKGNKDVPLKYWDITATTPINQGLEPGQTDEKINVIILDKNIKSVDIEATFLFEYETGHWEPVKKVTKTVSFNE